MFTTPLIVTHSTMTNPNDRGTGRCLLASASERVREKT